MKKFCILLTMFVLFISAYATAQSNAQTTTTTDGGKYVSCGHNHDGSPNGCMVFVPDEPIVDPSVQASPAGPTGGCTPRPYRQLVAYDDALLANYTHAQIVDLVMKAQKRFANALDSSGITNQVGTKIVGIIPVKIPTYTQLSTVFDWVSNLQDGVLDSLTLIKNELLDADHLLIISKEGVPVSGGKGVNLQVIYSPGADPEKIRTNLWKKNCGIVNFITFVPNLTSTFAHESGHSVGGDHENGSFTPTYARAYVNDAKQVNDLMKGARVESSTYNRFSGPNSKVIKNGETITLCEDTAVQNNAKHVSECLGMFWCATENYVTRVSIAPTTCGSGTLQAVTNNADTFQWKVISGTCTLGKLSGQSVSYMASSTSVVQMIGWKQGKWYADTAYITIPAVQTFPATMQKCVGTSITLPNGNAYVVSKDTTMAFMLPGHPCDSMVTLSIKALPTSVSSVKVQIKAGETHTLPDGKKVTMSGTYISTLKNSVGCDSIITTILTVVTATVDIEQLGIQLYPNPVRDVLIIEGLMPNDQVFLQDIIGKKQHAFLQGETITMGNYPAGVYLLTIQRGEKIAMMKLLKL